ncbi:MAG TPA: hypothetical protein VII49_03310 [Rhizomicrobium sp.]
MLVEIESWSASKKARFLARLAHELTVCSRGTYEAGTNGVLEPEVLRDFNEIQHRVTGSLRDHLLETRGMSLASVLEMVRSFGIRHHREKVIEGAISRVEQRASRDDPQPESDA